MNRRDLLLGMAGTLGALWLESELLPYANAAPIWLSSNLDLIDQVMKVREQESMGGPITAIPRFGLTPNQIPLAYALQNELIQRLRSRRNPLIGWKIGFSTASGRAPLSITEPAYGPLFESGALTGNSIFTKNFAGLLIEQEIVLVIKQNISQKLPSEELAQCVKAVHLGFELPSKRFTGAPGAPNGPTAADMIVDGLASHSHYVGPEISIDVSDPRALNMQITKDGAPFASGTTAMLDNGAGGLGPLKALEWLVGKLIDNGRCLKSGQIIFTGAVPGPMPFSKGNSNTTEFVTSAENMAQLNLKVIS